MKFPIAAGILVLSYSSLCIAGCFDFLNDLPPNSAADNFRKVIHNSQAKVDQEIEAHQRVIHSLQRQKQLLEEEDKKVVDLAHFLSSGPYQLLGLRSQIKNSSDNYVSLLMDTDQAEKHLDKTKSQYYGAAGKILQILRNIFESIGAKHEALPPPLFEVLEQLGQKWNEKLRGSDKEGFELLPELKMAAKFESLNMWDMAYSIYQNISKQFNETKEGNNDCDLALIEIYHKTIRGRVMMNAMQASEDDVPVFHFGKLRSKHEQAEIEETGLGTEREIFDQAIDLLNEEQWQPAYVLFKQAWAVFNETEAAGQDHSLDEVYILDYVQYSSFKVGRVGEAYAACLRALNHITLTAEQRTRFEVALDFYGKELSQTFDEEISKNIENFQLGAERGIFNAAVVLLNKEKWQLAYDLFMQAWKVYNVTEAAGKDHSLDEVHIVDYVQYSSFKVGRMEEAYVACLRALNHITLSEEQRTKFELALEVYRKHLLQPSTQRTEDVKLGTEKELFDRAFNLLGEQKWHEAYQGFKQAWKVFNETEAAGQRHSLDEVYIVDYVQHSSYKVNKLEEAHSACLHALNHITLTAEQRKRFEAAFEFYDQHASSSGIEDMYEKIDNVSAEEQITIAKKALSLKAYNLCQDEVAHKAMKKLSENPELFCRYDNRKRHPLLMVSPVKEEILSLSPVVTLVHGLILEKEIQSLKDAALNKLVSATIVNHTTQAREVQAHTRKSKSAWIETSAMPALTARLEASLGINPYGDGCEMYQVGHYNIGGHFTPHYDILFEAAKESGVGDRIATLLLYLNEVEEGGGTVFTDLQVRVNATKGAGVFWYNFHKNETPNLNTVHGACPVIRGEKWVTNKWYRWRGQLLHLPHATDIKEDFTLDDLNLPLELQYRTVENTEPGVPYPVKY